MPRGNKTGPNGMGPMTGRAAGFCTGNDEAGCSTAPGGSFGGGRHRGPGGASGGGRGRGPGGGCGRGREYGHGRGLGRGPGYARGYRYASDEGFGPDAPTEANRRAMVNAEIETLERRIDSLRREIGASDTRDPSEGA